MDPLAQFVERGLSAGHDKIELREALEAAGWPRDEVDDALARYADVAFPIPVPRPRRSGSAKEAFLYLVTFFALYVTAIALGGLFFGAIDRLIPEPLEGRYDYAAASNYYGLRWSMASLIVAFPIYALLNRSHRRRYEIEPERRQSSVRRWLTYLTLFVAAVVSIITTILLIADLLGGEFVMRGILKSLVVLAISGSVFGYYLSQMKREDRAEVT